MGMSPGIHGYQPPPAHSHGSGFGDSVGMQHQQLYSGQDGIYPPAHSHFPGQRFSGSYHNNPYNSGNQVYSGIHGSVSGNVSGNISGNMPNNLSNSMPNNMANNSSYSSGQSSSQSAAQPPHAHVRQTNMSQTPQEVANNILQMAASSYPPNQTVHVPINKRSAPYHVPRSPHYNNLSQAQSPSHSQMSGSQMPGHGRQFVYPNSSPHQQPSRTSPISPLHMHSPASHHSGQSLPNSSPSSLHSPQGSVKSPVPVASPIMGGLRSPSCGLQQMTSPAGTGQSMHSSPVNQPLHVNVPSNQASPHSGVYSGEIRSPPCSVPPQQQQSHSHFSPNPSTVASPMSHTGSPYTPGSKASIHSPQHAQSYSNPASVSQYISDHTEEPEPVAGPTSSNPLRSLQKLCMLPETQVIDPKSVVNDACMPSPQSNDNPKNCETGASLQKAVSSCHSGDNSASVCEVASGSEKSKDSSLCTDGKHCVTEKLNTTLSNCYEDDEQNASAKGIIPQSLIEDISEDEDEDSDKDVNSLFRSSDTKKCSDNTPETNGISKNAILENGGKHESAENRKNEPRGCENKSEDDSEPISSPKAANSDESKSVLMNGGMNCVNSESIQSRCEKSGETVDKFEEKANTSDICQKNVGVDKSDDRSSEIIPTVNNGCICTEDDGSCDGMCSEKKELLLHTSCTQTKLAKQNKLVEPTVSVQNVKLYNSDSDSSQQDQALIVRKDIYSTYSRKTRAGFSSKNNSQSDNQVNFNDLLSDSDGESAERKRKSVTSNQTYLASVDFDKDDSALHKSKGKRKLKTDRKCNMKKRKEMEQMMVDEVPETVVNDSKGKDNVCSSYEERLTNLKPVKPSSRLSKKIKSEKCDDTKNVTTDSEDTRHRSVLRTRKASWSKYEDNSFFKGDFILDDEEDEKIVDIKKEKRNNCVFLKNSPEKQLRQSEEYKSRKSFCSGEEPVSSDNTSVEENKDCDNSSTPQTVSVSDSLQAIKTEPIDDDHSIVKTEPMSDSRKKRGRPHGSRNKIKNEKRKLNNKVSKKLSKVGKGKNRHKLGDVHDSIQELKLKNTLNMMNKKGKEPSYNSAPYVRITGSRRHPVSCKVINQPDEESDIKSVKKKNVAHTVPSLQLSKLPSEKSVFCTSTELQDEALWVCALCGKHSSYRFLGDLFGPYSVEGHSSALSPDPRSKSKRKNAITSPTNEKNREKTHKEQKVNVRKRSLSNSSCDSLNSIIFKEAWVHEDCVVWSNGVYLIGSKIYGLEEAVRVATAEVSTGFLT